MKLALVITALWAVATTTAQTAKVVDCSKSDPCSECVGDCDTDDDCEGDLVCFQVIGRGRGIEIPGCDMKPVFSKTDFCVKPGFEVPEPTSRTCIGESIT